MELTFGEKIRESRKAKGLTQKQLADKIGAKHNSVSDWENNKNKPDPDTIEILCGVLSITPNYLLRNSENGFSSHERNIIEKYRSLDRYGKEVVNLVVDKEYERCQDQKEGSQIIQLPDPSMPEAAHERTDIKVTGEDIKYDDDIMADDKEWK